MFFCFALFLGTLLEGNAVFLLFRTSLEGAAGGLPHQGAPKRGVSIKKETKTADHNLARDILANMGLAFGFIAAKEVLVAPWFKKKKNRMWSLLTRQAN